MKVPVRNLYYLLCYAWDVLPPEDTRLVDALSATTPLELLARVLCREVERLVTRGLERTYVEYRDDLRYPRGQPDLERTMTRGLLPQGLLACRFEELREDTVANQLLRAALVRLTRTLGVDPNTRRRVRHLLQRFSRVTEVPLTASRFSRVVLHAHNARYRFALHVSELLARSTIPNENGGEYRFDDFTCSEQRLGELFEAFVRNLLRREQDLWRVTAPRLRFAHDANERDRRVLPGMETDLLLQGRSPELGAWIVECKCTKQPYVTSHGQSRLRNEHLYQLLTYLQTRAAHGIPTRGGVLLYAQVGERMHHDYVLNGHTVWVRSVDLAAAWMELRDQVLEIAQHLQPEAIA